MNSTDTQRDRLKDAEREMLELVSLEKLLDDSPECEYNHNGHAPQCSVEVTHVVTDCTGSGVVCRNGAEQALKYMKSPVCVCTSCHNFASECWKVRPV